MNEFSIEEQLKFYHILINSSPNLVIFKDDRGRYIKINNAAEKIFGLKKDLIYGKTDEELTDLVPHLRDFLTYSIRSDHLCYKERKTIVELTSIQDLKGVTYYFKMRKIPVFSPEGSKKGIIYFGKDITDLTVYKNYLELKTKFLSQAEHIAKMGSWYWEIASDYVYISDEFKRLFHYSEEDTKIKLDNFIDLFPENEKKFLLKNINDTSFQHNDYTLERVFQRDEKYFRHVITPFINKQIPYILGIIQDISEQKYMSYQLHLSKMIFDKANEGIVITDRDANIIEVNPAFSKITGYTKDEVIGQNPRILKSDKHSKEFYEKMWKDLLKNGFWEGEIWNRRKSGEVYPEILRIQAVKNEKGQITNYISIFYDLTKQKRLEEEHFFYRFYDPLTGLMNREYFVNKVKEKIESSNNDKFCIVLIDIDNFKQINEAFSYNLGDLILKNITDILIHLTGKNNVARIGEDAFAVVYKFNDYLEIDSLIQKIKKNILTLSLNGIKIDLTCCFGISIYPEDSKNPNDLLRFSESALNSARKRGPNNYSYFNKDILHSSINRLIKIEKLKDAVTNNRFVPFYQPKIDTTTEKIVGLEALARWITPTGEVVPPHEFIELAEETDLILDITKSIVYQVASHLKKLSQQYSNIKIPCAINLSMSCFLNVDWEKQLNSITKEFSIPIELFQIEITESMLMKNERLVSSSLKKLSNLGVLVCMDDFGTGYSSLYYLKNLPIDLVKIDKSFILPLTYNSKEKEIVKAIIDMCRALNIRVCAEGVETKEQLDILKELGCAQVQGYYFSKPVPFEELLPVIEQYK